MRVLMLGWEFPPFISGGLGTACYGLTKALSQQKAQVLFILPRPIDVGYTSHVRLLSPNHASPAYENETFAQVLNQQSSQSSSLPAFTQPNPSNNPAASQSHPLRSNDDHTQTPNQSPRNDMGNVIFHSVDARVPGGYHSAAMATNRPRAGSLRTGTQRGTKVVRRIDPATGKIIYTQADQQGDSEATSVLTTPGKPGETYDGDLISESKRYADLCVALALENEFDVIHAHDWMTFPAGLAVAAATGKPLVVHVHSTEFDRSGANVYQPVYDIERRGMRGACRVIAVSHLTRNLIQHRYGIDAKKIDVVYNGIECQEHGRDTFNSQANISRKDKIVLFLGRITMQKGPEYFVAAAKKVLEKYEHVKFVIAGTGDKIRDVIDLAASEGIGHKVLFTGFLHKKDVERVFKMADVYVMPSVSEPFGIAPLEAISHDVPVIISKTSGVAEVLTHALKVDFWDTHEIANKIIAVLRYPPLSNTLREHADMEVRRLTWDGAATRCQDVYAKAMDMMPV